MGNETQNTTREKGRECRYSTSVGSHRQNSPQIEKERAPRHQRYSTRGDWPLGKGIVEQKLS